MITQALIYKKDNGKRSREGVGFTELLEKVDKTWKKTQKDVASSMAAGTTVLTKLIRSRLKDNNEMSSRLKFTKKSLFKVSSDESGDFFRFRYEYDFPISTSKKRWKYGFFFADPKVKLGNVDAIRRWLKKKAAQGMNVYYIRRTKDGVEKLPPTKDWHWNKAANALIRSKKGGVSDYKPDKDWWKLDIRGKDKQVLEETLLSKQRHLIQYYFKEGWNKLPR